MDRRRHLRCDDCLKSFRLYCVNHDNCPGKLVLFGHCYLCDDSHQIEESGSSDRFCSGTTFDSNASARNEHHLGVSSPFHSATEYPKTPNNDPPPSPNHCHISSLDSVQYIYDTSQDTNGCIPPASNFLLPDARLSSASDLNIHPLELELMNMINKQNLPPIMYDRIMFLGQVKLLLWVIILHLRNTKPYFAGSKVVSPKNTLVVTYYVTSSSLRTFNLTTRSIFGTTSQSPSSDAPYATPMLWNISSFILSTSIPFVVNVSMMKSLQQTGSTKRSCPPPPLMPLAI